MFTSLQLSVEDNICLVTVNRPEKLNALNRTVFQELNVALDQIFADPIIQSAIITGSGSKAFVAGADISEFSNYSCEEAKALSRQGQETFSRIEQSPKPIVAAVNGFALGGGCELAMSCHFRIASTNAKFGQPEVNLGLIPGYGGTQRLVQLIGKGRAMEYLMSAGMMDAEAALKYGLVNHITSPEELMPKAKEILSMINSKAPLAVAACIKAANAVFDESQNGFETEISLFGECFNTEDMKEGVQAFLEKRKANFKNR
jgi:enoyl-CoA hydratase